MEFKGEIPWFAVYRCICQFSDCAQVGRALSAVQEHADLLCLHGELIFEAHLRRQLIPTSQPTRTYYLEDVERTSITWVDTISQMIRLQKAEQLRQSQSA